MRFAETQALRFTACLGLGFVYAAAYVFPLLGSTQAYFLPSLWTFVAWPALVATVTAALALFIALRLVERRGRSRVSTAAHVGLTALLCLLAIKAAIDAADLSWMHIVGWLAANRSLNAVRATQVALTFASAAALGLAFYLLRGRIRECLRFLSMLGFAFAILALVRILGYAHLSPASADAAQRHAVGRVPSAAANATFAGVPARAGSWNRRVIWVVFDELDYGRTLGDARIRAQMPNFVALEARAVSAIRAYSPAANTAESIPALLMGELPKGVRYGPPGNLHLELADGSTRRFGMQGSVFSRLPDGAASASILGYYHPYCSIFTTMGACSSHYLGNAGRWFDGLTFFSQALFSAGRWLDGFVDAVPHSLWRSFDPMFSVTEGLIDMLPAALERTSDALTFVHMSLPHVPGSYAQKVFRLPHTADDLEMYNGNVTVADWVLGRIVASIAARRGSRDELLLISSDHWLRRASPASAQPVPFIAWSTREDRGLRLESPINTVDTANLVLDFLNGRVTSQQDIVDWWRARPFEPPSIERGRDS